MEIGERIRARREELGMSQDELAKKVGYTSRSSVAKVETNANGMVQSKVVAFAKALQTTPAYLMGWEDETEKKNDNTTSEPDELSQKEKQLILDFRSLNSQGQELILQQMFMAKEVYKKDTDVSDMEIVG